MSDIRPYDAVFLAVALGLFLTQPRRWWLAAFAPAIALATHWIAIGGFATPVAVIAACLLVPRYAPAAIVLAIPIYEGPTDVLGTAVLWLVVSVLIKGLEERISDGVLDSPARRTSARLLSVVILYYTLQPVMFL